MANVKSPFSLFGKKILVTGASSGIGKQIAVSIVNQGGYVYITGRNIKNLNLLKNQLGNNNCKVFAVDLTEFEAMIKMVKEIDYIDGLVHSAGLISMSPYKFIKEEAISRIFSINYEAPLKLTTNLLKLKKIKNSSSIVFISSINGSCIGAKGFTLYSSSKGAISGLVKSLSVDLAKSKIRVNEIAPGMIVTEGVKSIEDSVSKASINEDMKKYPLGGYGVPEDVANGCVYLLSNASSWVTGIKLVIDGGFTVL
ncbi:SDR family NAD(P)-dependent oxidoreductase [Polaribacter septentrionalilitoris]|uniref:SDR family NAD(P)-dependent oxidoreductase n=1 Tax=Polaribacter septentrionalilitoris TaxID=2494657 RepID=UPI00135688D7|nr:SDR family oxidoreductase [Polaribacter septentrionalilitoris]